MNFHKITLEPGECASTCLQLKMGVVKIYRNALIGGAIGFCVVSRLPFLENVSPLYTYGSIILSMMSGVLACGAEKVKSNLEFFCEQMEQYIEEEPYCKEYKS